MEAANRWSTRFGYSIILALNDGKIGKRKDFFAHLHCRAKKLTNTQTLMWLWLIREIWPFRCLHCKPLTFMTFSSCSLLSSPSSRWRFTGAERLFHQICWMIRVSCVKSLLDDVLKSRCWLKEIHFGGAVLTFAEIFPWLLLLESVLLMVKCGELELIFLNT